MKGGLKAWEGGVGATKVTFNGGMEFPSLDINIG